jgi:argininosuccinate lyase
MNKRLWDKGQSLNSEIHRFTVGQDYVFDQRLAAFDALASAAHAQMLRSRGALTESECSDLLHNLRSIYEESRAGSFRISPDMEDCHTAIELRLSDVLGTVGKKIHTGRSRNDQVLVALRLFVREEILSHLQALRHLADVLCVRAKQELRTPLPGYTHMQRAMPTTAATHLLSYAQYALSLIQNGLTLFEDINWNPLGVGSGFGVPFDVRRDLTTQLLGFRSTQENPIFVQSTRGREELKFVNWLVDIQSLIERSAVDLMLFSTEEFGLVTIPADFTTGSSIMPQKRNPDVLELLRAQASRTRAARGELEAITAKLPSSYHRDYQYTKEPLFRATDMTSQMLPIFCAVVEAVKFSPERGLAMFSPELFATHYAYALVEQGQPFRDAYNAAAVALAEGRIDVKDFIAEFLNSEEQRARAEQRELSRKLAECVVRLGQASDAHSDVCSRVFELQDC